MLIDSSAFCRYVLYRVALLGAMFAPAALSTGCTTEAPTTGTTEAAISVKSSPAIVQCDGDTCSVEVDIDDSGFLTNIHEVFDFGCDEDDMDIVYRGRCSPPSKYKMVCSRWGKCPTGTAVWCKSQTCFTVHGGIEIPTTRQVNCVKCGAGVTPNDTGSNCSPV